MTKDEKNALGCELLERMDPRPITEPGAQNDFLETLALCLVCSVDHEDGISRARAFEMADRAGHNVKRTAGWTFKQAIGLDPAPDGSGS